MNKIFKVIWSKSKQCYIVVSELAKNTTGKKKIIVASVFAALAMTGGMQDVHAVDAPGNRAGFSSSGNVGTAFNPTEGTVLGPYMPGAFDQTTRAKGNVATVAIGAHSEAFGGSSVAMGGGTAYGDKAGTKGNIPGQGGAIALGWVTAKGNRAVALGGIDTTSATGDNAFAASGGVVNGDNSFAVSGGNATGNNTFAAVGGTAGAGGAISIGWNGQASAQDTTAVGSGAQATKQNAAAFGHSAQATESSATAIGNGANASESDTLALGTSAAASASDAVAIGKSSKASANSAVAIG